MSPREEGKSRKNAGSKGAMQLKKKTVEKEKYRGGLPVL